METAGATTPSLPPFVFDASSFAEFPEGTERGDEAAAVDVFHDALDTWNNEGGAALRLRDGGLFDDSAPEPDILIYQGRGTLSRAIAQTTTSIRGGDEITSCDIQMFSSNLFGSIDWSLDPAGAPDGELDLRHNMIH